MGNDETKALINKIDEVSTEYGLDVGSNTILDLIILLAQLSYKNTTNYVKE